jgi:hypothetical protein
MHHNHDSGCGSWVHNKAEATAEYVAAVDEDEQEDEGEDEEGVDIVGCFGKGGGGGSVTLGLC